MASRRSPPPRPIRCSGPKPPHSPIPMRSMTLIQNRSRAAMVERKIPSCRFVTILMGTAAWILRQRLFVAVNWFSLECTPNLPICQTAGGLGCVPKSSGARWARPSTAWLRWHRALEAPSPFGSLSGTRVAMGERGALAPRLRLSRAVYGQAKRPAAQPDQTGTCPGGTIRVCPNFVGPGRFVGQLQAVVLQLWDTPYD